ncbi:MAG: AAA family ATPase, partial [Planctomycetes bacterium]|nr:AAA family ATPase [Planctomycetota bacterium]
MLALLQSSWSNAAEKLRERVGSAAFDAWLSELRPMALERGVVHLEAPNRLACEHVGKLYASLIAEVLSTEIGTQLSVRVDPTPTAFTPDGVDVGPTRPVVDEANEQVFLTLGSLIEGRELPSPIFYFHGPSGSGKSFLLSWWRGHGRARVLSFDGPHLIKVFQAALQERRVAGLREELSKPMPLVIDEVHRLSGHNRLQRELCKVLEIRRGLRQPTILVSRWHPGEVWNLDATLRTWFLSGFVARIDLPTLSGRLQFLRALEGKPSMNGRALPIEELARNVRGGYPELRKAWSLERDGGRTHERYWQLIEPRSLFDRVQRRVSEALGVSLEELVGQSQRRRASHARKVLAWLCVREGLNRAEVGRFLGGR